MVFVLQQTHRDDANRTGIIGVFSTVELLKDYVLSEGFAARFSLKREHIEQPWVVDPRGGEYIELYDGYSIYLSSWDVQ